MPVSVDNYGVGSAVEYFSATLSQWIPAKVLKINSDRNTFNLDCKPEVPVDRIRNLNSDSQVKQQDPGVAEKYSTALLTDDPFPVNSAVEYFSATVNTWIAARVVYRNSDGTYNLDCKSLVPKDRIRVPIVVGGSTSNTVNSQINGPVSQTGVVPSTHFDNNLNFKGGPNSNGNDINLNQNQTTGPESESEVQDKLPHLPGASQFNAGETVEYFSATLNSWIAARVMSRNSDGTLNLDCKPMVGMNRIRKGAFSHSNVNQQYQSQQQQLNLQSQQMSSNSYQNQCHNNNITHLDDVKLEDKQNNGMDVIFEENASVSNNTTSEREMNLMNHNNMNSSINFNNQNNSLNNQNLNATLNRASPLSQSNGLNGTGPGNFNSFKGPNGNINGNSLNNNFPNFFTPQVCESVGTVSQLMTVDTSGSVTSTPRPVINQEAIEKLVGQCYDNTNSLPIIFVAGPTATSLMNVLLQSLGCSQIPPQSSNSQVQRTLWMQTIRMITKSDSDSNNLIVFLIYEGYSSLISNSVNTVNSTKNGAITAVEEALLQLGISLSTLTVLCNTSPELVSLESSTDTESNGKFSSTSSCPLLPRLLWLTSSRTACPESLTSNGHFFSDVKTSNLPREILGVTQNNSNSNSDSMNSSSSINSQGQQHLERLQQDLSQLIGQSGGKRCVNSGSIINPAYFGKILQGLSNIIFEPIAEKPSRSIVALSQSQSGSGSSYLPPFSPSYIWSTLSETACKTVVSELSEEFQEALDLLRTRLPVAQDVLETELKALKPHWESRFRRETFNWLNPVICGEYYKKLKKEHINRQTLAITQDNVAAAEAKLQLMQTLETLQGWNEEILGVDGKFLKNVFGKEFSQQEGPSETVTKGCFDDTEFILGKIEEFVLKCNNSMIENQNDPDNTDSYQWFGSDHDDDDNDSDSFETNKNSNEGPSVNKNLFKYAFSLLSNYLGRKTGTNSNSSSEYSQSFLSKDSLDKLYHNLSHCPIPPSKSTQLSQSLLQSYHSTQLVLLYCIKILCEKEKNIALTQKKLKLLKYDLDKKDEEIKELLEDIESVKGDHEKTLKDKVEMQERIEELEDEVETQKNQKNNIDVNNNTSGGTVSDEELTTLKQQLSDERTEKDDLLLLRESLESEIKELKSDLDNVRDKFERELDRSESLKDTLTRMSEKGTDSEKELLSQLESKDIKLSELESIIESQDQQTYLKLEKEREKRENDREKFECERKDLMREIDKIKIDLKEDIERERLSSTRAWDQLEKQTESSKVLQERLDSLLAKTDVTNNVGLDDGANFGEGKGGRGTKFGRKNKGENPQCGCSLM